MKIYFALVHQDAESAYGVQFPDLPGCYSAADELDNLIENATQALTLYFEDQVVVKSRSLVEIRSDENVAASLAQGAFLVGVPY